MKEQIDFLIKDTINAIDELERIQAESNKRERKRERVMIIVMITGVAIALLLGLFILSS